MRPSNDEGSQLFKFHFPCNKGERWIYILSLESATCIQKPRNLLKVDYHPVSPLLHHYIWPAVLTALPVLVTFFAAYAFPNIAGANVPNDFEGNPAYCLFASFLIVLLVPDSSSDLTIFIISFFSSFEIINAVLLDPWIFFE